MQLFRVSGYPEQLLTSWRFGPVAHRVPRDIVVAAQDRRRQAFASHRMMAEEQEGMQSADRVSDMGDYSDSWEPAEEAENSFLGER